MNPLPRSADLRLVTLLSVLTLLLAACAASGPNRPGPAVPEPDLEQLHALVNEARGDDRRCGDESFPAAEPLALHEDLMQAAQAHSDDMHEGGFLDHTGSDGSGVSDRVERTDYGWSSLGEIVARGYGTPEAVMEAWLASPAHCGIIMRSDYTELGMGVAGTSWTQVFARPRESAPSRALLHLSE